MTIKQLILAGASYSKTPTGYWMNLTDITANLKATGVCVDGDGNSYFAMWNEWEQYSRVFKFGVNGEVLWSKDYANVGINGLATNGTSGIIAVGTSYPDYHFCMINISLTGTVNWSYRYGAAGQYGGYLLNAVVGASGNIYACGYYMGPGVDMIVDGAVFKISSAGAFVWQKYYTGSSTSERTYNVALDASENVYVTGMGTGSGAALIKFDTNGNQLLSRVMSEGFALDVDSSGNIYFQSERHSICKMTAAGAKTWEKYQGVWNEFVVGVQVDASGNVYVLQDAIAENDGFWLYKYNSSGTLLWFRSLGVSGFSSGYSFYGKTMTLTSNAIFISLNHTGTNKAVFLKIRTDGTVEANTPPVNYRTYASPSSGDGVTAMSAATFSIVARAGVIANAYAQGASNSSATVTNIIL